MSDLGWEELEEEFNLLFENIYSCIATFKHQLDGYLWKLILTWKILENASAASAKCREKASV